MGKTAALEINAAPAEPQRLWADRTTKQCDQLDARIREPDVTHHAGRGIQVREAAEDDGATATARGGRRWRLKPPPRFVVRPPAWFWRGGRVMVNGRYAAEIVRRLRGRCRLVGTDVRDGVRGHRWERPPSERRCPCSTTTGRRSGRWSEVPRPLTGMAASAATPAGAS